MLERRIIGVCVVESVGEPELVRKPWMNLIVALIPRKLERNRVITKRIELYECKICIVLHE